jgi:hypothetical protein
MGRRILTSPSSGAYGCSRVRYVSIFRQAAGRSLPAAHPTIATLTLSRARQPSWCLVAAAVEPAAGQSARCLFMSSFWLLASLVLSSWGVAPRLV